jgi:hypothetical protein
MSRRILQGLREIAEYLGLHGEGANSRRLLLSWIDREGLPARRLAGRWYADLDELEKWWSSRTATAKRSPEPRKSAGAIHGIHEPNASRQINGVGEPNQNRQINGIRPTGARRARRPSAGSGTDFD